MSAFDLETEEGLHAFLATNFVAWSCLAKHWGSFLANTLGVEAPDYPQLLRQDLDELSGCHAALPALTMAYDITAPEGMAYVLAGSRIGMATIRKRPNWAAHSGLAQRFMNDNSGPDIFRAVVAHLNSLPEADGTWSAATRSAEQTFELFVEALAVVRAA